MADPWHTTLITPGPETGYAFAVKVSRAAVKITQPDDEVRSRLWEFYEGDVAAFIKVSVEVATNFATAAAANDSWRAE